MTPPDAPRQSLFAYGGTLGQMIASHDWTRSPLGPIADWPEALVDAVSLMLPAGAEIVLFWGPEYVALYNDAYAPTIGDKHPRALGRPAREAWTELWDDLEPLLARVRETGETYSAKDRPFYIERAGYGEEVFFDISYSAVRLADGSVGGVLCIVSETTPRVRAARALAAESERLAQMFEQAPGFIAVLRGSDHVFELANQSYHRLIGDRHGTIVGKRIRDVLPEIEGQGYVDLLDTVFATGEAYRADGALVTLERGPDGAEGRFVDFVFQPLTDADGAVTGVFVEGTDVTERHLVEKALAESRESLMLATEAAEIGTWDIDLTTMRLYWSDRAKQMFGMLPGAKAGFREYFSNIHPDDESTVRAAFAVATDPMQRGLYEVEYRAIGVEDGITRWIAAKGRGIFEGDRCVRATGTMIDITQRRAIEEELRESEARFRSLADSLPALVWINDAEGKLLFVNRAFETLLGYAVEDVMRDGWQLLYPAKDRAIMRDYGMRRLADGRPFSGDIRLVDAGGETRWVHVEGRPRLLGERFLGYVGCAVEVTEAHLAGEALERRIAERTSELTEQIAERERVEATLHQMQRLEAVGQLTSGVAHDFNNLLTVVLGNVGLIARGAERAGLDDRMRERLEHIRAAAERGATLTQQLLAFSRRQRLETRAIDLNETIGGMVHLLQSSLGGAIAIEARPAEGLWHALVDPNQIELSILNLAINARDAMPGGGRLIVAAENATLGDPLRPEEPPAGDYVRVSVTDSGTGMTEDVLARAFEPFFTTKEVGKGSGLGLAQVFGFAQQSGGGVRIDSMPGEGTTVSIFLPRGAVPEAATTPRPVFGPNGSIAGRTVMVLDDDDAVRSVTAAELREAGCRVVEAADGAAALEALVAEPGIAAVVADFAMPGMNGVDFSARAQAQRPDLPIVLVTGYADLAAIAAVPEDQVMQKPFAPGAVAARIRAMLDGAPGGAG